MKKLTSLPLVSKTLIVAILTVIAGVLAHYGYNVSPEEIELIAGSIVAAITAISAVFAVGTGIKNRKVKKSESNKEEIK